MKKELSPVAMWAMIGLAVVVIGGMGMFFVNQTSGTAEDPELARKQWEVERSRTPGGGSGTTNAAPPQSGFSPGREAELEARQKTGQNSGQ